MYALALALIPAIVLLVYIYKKDNREKEPMKLLWKCFFWGVISIIPAILLEEAGSFFFESDMVNGSIEYAFVDGFIIAALSEELCKYIMLKKCTWKAPEFNCSFDGIVYAVYVSLGFAAFENIFYVLDGGISIAILRMFTAVPLHALDAVYMGYYYSKAKEASLMCNIPGNTTDRADNQEPSPMRKYRRKALFVPIILHGIYDFLLSTDSEVVGDTIFFLCVLIWVAFVITMFIFSLRLVKKASANDEYFITPVEPPVTDFPTTGDGSPFSPQ